MDLQIRKFCLLLGSALFVPVLSWSSTITFSAQYPVLGFATLNFGGGAASPNGTVALSVPKYDPSQYGGEQLLAVSWTFTGTENGTAEAINDADTPNTVTLQFQSLITVQDPSHIASLTVNPLLSSTETLAINQGYGISGSPNDTYSQDRNILNANAACQTTSTCDEMILSNVTSSASSTFGPDSNAALLAEFTGTGNILLPLGASGDSAGSDTAGNVSIKFQGAASGEIEVTYTIAGPEPNSWLLAGIPLLGIGLLGLQRRNRL